MLSHLDLLLAFLTTAGAAAPKDRILDGRDCLPALTSHANTPHERLFFHLRDAVAVREGSLKLIRPKAKAGWELYDLAADPSEKHNLATERSQDMQRLADAITRWQLDMKNDASEPVTYKAAKKVN